VYPVRRFTEKPALETAKAYLASGNYLWNAGMFFWRASTFWAALREFLPATCAQLDKLTAVLGRRRYHAELRKVYAKLENISVDYAILERATRQSGAPQVFVVPAEVGWSDIGSWAAVYELLAKEPGQNIFASAGHAMESSGNYVSGNGKFVAAIGVKDLIIVDSADALLVCPRDRAQDVGKLVKWLEEQKKRELL
jgi:mannose-1-phosphate guanylyltransferase